jgi:hypothetical protein
MSDILELVSAKQKAIDVIDSCTTTQHTVGAKNYVELFNNKYDDFLTYTVLKHRLDVRKEEIKGNDKKN